MLSKLNRHIVRALLGSLAILGTSAFATSCTTDSEEQTVQVKQPTLIFVHGWACDSTYWQEQVAVFGETHPVIAIDLPGHGTAPADSEDYTIDEFAQAVTSRADASGADEFILIGHSMGGPVVVEAATTLGDKVVGVGGVDTLKSTGRPPLPQPAAAQAFGYEASEFAQWTTGLVRSRFFVDSSPQELQSRISTDMAADDPEIARSAGISLMMFDIAGALSQLNDAGAPPIVLINSDYTPTDTQALSEHYPNSSVKLMSDVGHFVMLEKPIEFNETLSETILGFSE